MPVYEKPSLLDAIIEPLKNQMQGKSCFNFIIVEKTLLTELTALTKNRYDFYAKESHV